MIYTMGHEFTDGEITIRFRENGIFANGQCMTFAPTVSDFDGYQAIVTAMILNIIGILSSLILRMER